MSADRPARPVAAICGENILFPPNRLGCGEVIPTCAEVYRCTECTTPFHRECAISHFGKAHPPAADQPVDATNELPVTPELVVGENSELHIGKALRNYKRAAIDAAIAGNDEVVRAWHKEARALAEVKELFASLEAQRNAAESRASQSGVEESLDMLEAEISRLRVNQLTPDEAQHAIGEGDHPDKAFGHHVTCPICVRAREKLSRLSSQESPNQ